MQKLLQRIIKTHKRVIFNGDNYSKEWVIEAEKRGLPNLRGTLAAIEPLKNADNQELMTRYGVFSKSELDSRYEISLEEYFRKLRIECGIAIEIARSMIHPAATDEFNRVCRALGNVYSGFDFLAAMNIPSVVYNMLPYIISLVVLAFTSKKSRAPKAEGIPYDKGTR